MKRRLLLFVLLTTVSLSAFADVRTVQWDYPNPPPKVISGFKLYCGNATAAYAPTPVATVGPTTYTAQLTLAPGVTVFCVVRAYDAASESGNSNEVSVTGRVDPPTGLRVVP